MEISSNGLEFIKQHEGLYLHAYDDGVGVMTIGYGHTKNVKRGDVITLQQAEEYLRDDLKEFEQAINSLNLQLKQNEFDAFVSFYYNTESLTSKSIFTKYINGDSKESIAV